MRIIHTTIVLTLLIIPFIFKTRKVEVELCTSPNDAKSHNSLGLELAKSGNINQAIKEFKSALSMNPEFNDAANNLALAHLSLGEIDVAKEILEKLLEKSPNFSQAINNLGVIYLKEENFDEAETNFSRAIEIDPMYEKAYVNLTRTLIEQNRLNDAMSCMEQAINIEKTSHNNEILLCYGTLCMMLKEYHKALASFEKLKSIGMNNKDFNFKLANAYLMCNKFTSAQEIYTQLLTQEKDNPLYRYFLGDALFLEGKYADARKNFEEILQIKPDTDKIKNIVTQTPLRVAKCFEMEKDLMQARQVLDDVLKNPQSGWQRNMARQELQRIEYNEKQLSKAVKKLAKKIG